MEGLQIRITGSMADTGCFCMDPGGLPHGMLLHPFEKAGRKERIITGCPQDAGTEQVLDKLIMR